MTDFKAFHSGKVRFRPLTILVGENNSGKSSLIAALRLLAQTVQSPDTTVPLLFDGPFGDFGAYVDVVHGNHRGRPMHLGLTVSARSATEKATGAPIVSFLSEFKYRTQRRETILRSTRLSAGSYPLVSI